MQAGPAGKGNEMNVFFLGIRGEFLSAGHYSCFLLHISVITLPFFSFSGAEAKINRDNDVPKSCF